jgi:septin family protein
MDMVGYMWIMDCFRQVLILSQVDNEEHCDFIKLRQMLIRTHMEELKDSTNRLLYENYRAEKLSSGNYSVDVSSGEVK